MATRAKGTTKGRAQVTLLIATRKGLWTLAGDATRRTWKLAGPHFLGHIVHHARVDPRDGKTLLAAARTGHLGPTIFRSTDRGRTWKEAARPPAFAADSGRTVDHTFWLAPGHPSQPGVWYAGTSPQGLFRSEDGGVTWTGVDGFNAHPQRKAWCGGDQDGTPDGPKLHSILIDPRDPAHMYIGMSSGGVFESQDGGRDWHPLNRGVKAEFLPDPNAEYGHDPHCVRLSPVEPDRLYQQNHCGIFRLDRPDTPVDRHRRRHAQERRPDRLPDGAASARPRNAMGVPDGREQRVAARVARRQAGGVPLGQRRTHLAPAECRVCRPRRPGGPSSVRQ